ncbi:MAG: Zn-ribbon domain-containing OB-fold protein [Promethearchaeota archaeon]
MSVESEFTIKEYFDYLKEGKLMGNKCKKCGALFVPPRKICSSCLSTEMEWFEFSGKGKLATYSLIHVGTRYFVAQGYKMGKPYCFGVVELEEGPKVPAHIVGPTKEFEYDPNNFKVGMPLKMKILKVEIEGQEPHYDLGFEPI